jgi:cold shock CspA family protein
MEVPVQIDFQGMSPVESIRRSIIAHIAELEDRFGRIIACRVVLKGPSTHHLTGGLYEVNIHLTLPDGREVAVVRTPYKDERHSDLAFAINDAFKRARRRLQDQVRRLQGQVKMHEAQPIATVKLLEPEENFGFLETNDGREIYFHRNSVLNNEFANLKIGTRVTFVETMGDKGPQASTVKCLGQHGMRA